MNHYKKLPTVKRLPNVKNSWDSFLLICQYKAGHKATHTHQMYQERDMEMALHCDMCTGMFELHLLGGKKKSLLCYPEICWKRNLWFWPVKVRKIDCITSLEKLSYFELKIKPSHPEILFIDFKMYFCGHVVSGFIHFFSKATFFWGVGVPSIKLHDCDT